MTQPSYNYSPAVNINNSIKNKQHNTLNYFSYQNRNKPINIPIDKINQSYHNYHNLDKVYSNPVYYQQTIQPNNIIKRVSNLSTNSNSKQDHYKNQFPYTQRFSLHSDPDLQIVINNNTYQDHKLSLNVDSFDKASGRSSVQKYQRLIPAHSKYFFQSNFKDNHMENQRQRIHTNNLHKINGSFGSLPQSYIKQRSSFSSYIPSPTNYQHVNFSVPNSAIHSPRNNFNQRRSSEQQSQIMTNSLIVTNMPKYFNTQSYQYAYPNGYQQLVQKGFSKMSGQSPSKITQFKPRQESIRQEQIYQNTQRNNASTQVLQSKIQKQQNFSFKDQPSSRKASSSKFQEIIDSVDIKIPILYSNNSRKKQDQIRIQSNQDYQQQQEQRKRRQPSNCKCTCHQNKKNCKSKKHKELHLQKSFHKKDSKFIIGKNKLMDKIKANQKFNPLKSKLQNNYNSIQRSLSRERKLSPRCQLITDRLYNNSRSKSRNQSPCPKYQKYQQTVEKMKFRQKIKQYGFVERYLSERQLDDMYLKLSQSDIPEHKWAIKVIDHVYQKMNYVCKCCNC